MADLPTVFSESAATRIGAATRWAELQQGIPQDGYGSSPGNGLCLVRTRTTLPAGYTGAIAALGDVIEKQPDGTINTLGQVWIKDQNGGTLSANTIYQARVGGTFAQNITTNGITAPTTLGLYLVQAIGFSKIRVRPNRWAYLEGKNKAGVKYYLRAVVWTESGYDADSYDVPVYVDSSMFTLEGYPEPYASRYIADGSYSASVERTNCFCDFKIDDKTNYTWADLEKTPALLNGEMGQAFFEFSPSDLTEVPYWFIYPTIHDGDYPTDFVFTRRNLIDKNGQKKIIVKYINTNLAKQIGNFISEKWYFNEVITTYYENKYGYYPWGGGVSYIEKTYPAGTITTFDKKITLIVPDPFGLGYLKKTDNYYYFPKYLFGPISYSDKVSYYPIQVLHANSPLHPIKATTSGIGSGIGSGISGV